MYYLLSLFWILILSSCQLLTAPKKVSRKPSSERLIASKQDLAFWKAEKDNQIFYILGTIHLGVSLSELQCTNIIQDKIKNSPFVFTENFSPETAPLYNNYVDAMKKLYLGSKEEREQIMSQFSEQTRKKIMARINFIKLMNKQAVMNAIGTKFIEDEGQFKDLSKDSQNFLIQHGLYDKNKNYLDYFFDIVFVTNYDAFFSLKKILDAEIIKLALDHNIPILSLDENKKTVSKLEKEIEELKNKRTGREVKINKADIDQMTANYESLKQTNLDHYSNLISGYKPPDREIETKASESLASRIVKWLFGRGSSPLLQNRNELWVEKMLSSNEDQAIFLSGGYLHFIGYNNVLDILEKKGFKITLIDSESCKF